VRRARQHPELVSLARTVSRREDEIVAAVITGVTNATSESLNRLAKLEIRQAYGFRDPMNQRRRVRIACTRGYRRRSRTTSRTRTQPVTGRQPGPGSLRRPDCIETDPGLPHMTARGDPFRHHGCQPVYI
jgi:hypothetical protein